MSIEILENEIFKEVQLDTKYKYWVSNLGRFHNGKKIMKLGSTVQGYKYAYFVMNKKKRQNVFIHRLVLMTFSPNENQDSLQVNHKDRNPSNNTLENLEWVTSKENINHAFDEKALNHINKIRPKAIEKRSVAVEVLENDVYTIYNSVTEAGKELKVKHQRISYLAKTGKVGKEGFSVEYV